jgi:acyl-CoA thioester hydrolase
VAGGYAAIRARGIEALTTGVEVTYERAAVFDDVLTVQVRCSEARGARFRYEYVVERDGERIATGSTRHATVDATTHRPVRVPDWLLGDLLNQSPRSGS